jgi:hypothetical protein
MDRLRHRFGRQHSKRRMAILVPGGVADHAD